MKISIVVPVLNEAREISGLLASLAAEDQPFEILVADGGSTDETVKLAAASGARVCVTAPGRGIQMNGAAAVASGEVLLFLHADTRPAPGALAAIRQALADPTVVGGNLDLRFDGGTFTARLFTWINRVRCRVFGIFYGDSGIFCRRTVFQTLCGYQDWPLMEDYDFAMRLARYGRLAMLRHPIQVSDRRWRRGGLLGTLWAWFWVQGLYLVGVSPHRLARLYRHVR